jgi:hypothetical protein
MSFKRVHITKRHERLKDIYNIKKHPAICEKNGEPAQETRPVFDVDAKKC